MKLWKLEREGDYGYDQFIGFVIRASSENRARQLASEKGDIWLDSEETTCTQIFISGEEEIILESYSAG